MKSGLQIFLRDFIWTVVLIILNPFNLIALYSRYTGKVFVGIPNTLHAHSPEDIFKVLVLPTLIYALIWIILKKWKRWSYWNLYFFSFLGSIIVFYVLFNYVFKT